MWWGVGSLCTDRGDLSDHMDSGMSRTPANERRGQLTIKKCVCT